MHGPIWVISYNLVFLCESFLLVGDDTEGLVLSCSAAGMKGDTTEATSFRLAPGQRSRLLSTIKDVINGINGHLNVLEFQEPMMIAR